jgi:hypothetical protein
MAILFSDDFNRANGALGANWDAATDDFHAIVSNEAVYSVGGGPCLTDVAAHAATADVIVSFTIASTMAGFDGGVCARANFNLTGSTGDGYVLNVFSGTYELYRRINNVNGTALVSASNTTAEGDVWSLYVSGVGATVTLKVLRNGAQVGSDISDSAGNRITQAARTGFYSWANGSAYDDFLVTDLAGAPAGSAGKLVGKFGTILRGKLG